MKFEVFPENFSIAIFSMPKDYVERVEREVKEGYPNYANLGEFQLFVGKAFAFEEWQYKGKPQKVIVRIRRAGMMPLEFLGTISEGKGIILDTVRKNDLLYSKKDELWYG